MILDFKNRTDDRRAYTAVRLYVARRRGPLALRPSRYVELRRYRVYDSDTRQTTRGSKSYSIRTLRTNTSDTNKRTKPSGRCAVAPTHAARRESRAPGPPHPAWRGPARGRVARSGRSREGGVERRRPVARRGSTIAARLQL